MLGKYPNHSIYKICKIEFYIDSYSEREREKERYGESNYFITLLSKKSCALPHRMNNRR